MVKVGVNRFGRIGRLVTRTAFTSGKVDVVAINDPSLTSTAWSTCSIMTPPIASSMPQSRLNGKLIITGKAITIFQEQDPANIKWGNAGAKYVVESTGVLINMEKAGAHLRVGPKGHHLYPFCRCPMFVMGVDHEKYDNSLKIVSNVSCTTNCLDPLDKDIHDNFGIVEGLMTTVHPSLPPRRLWIAPLGSCGEMARGCPEHHPCICWYCQGCGQGHPRAGWEAPWYGLPCSYPQCVHCGYDIKKVVKQASEGPLKGILSYTEDQVDSRDFNSDTHSSTFDARAGVNLNDVVKLISWYNSEYGYSNRVDNLTASKASKE